MIKPVISNPIRKTIIGTMMAGAVATGAVAQNRQNQENSSNHVQYTEVSSKEAAEGVKLLAFASTPADNIVRNKYLDKNIIALSENAEEAKQNQAFLDDSYNRYGTYGGTLHIQLTLDEALLTQAITKFQKDISVELWEMQAIEDSYNDLPEADKMNILALLGKFSESNSSKMDVDKMVNEMADASNSFRNYLDNDFVHRRRAYGDILSPDALNKNGKPNFEKTSALIDKFANETFTTTEERTFYKSRVNLFNIDQDGSTTTESKINLLSYKLFLIDKMMAEKFLNSNSYFKDNEEFHKYLEREFLSKEPKALRQGSNDAQNNAPKFGLG